MEELSKTEAYLKARVEMEKITHLLLLQFSSEMNLSYRKIVELLHNKPHVEDLLFLMKDTFPAHFPKLVLLTSLMEKMLKL